MLFDIFVIFLVSVASFVSAGQAPVNLDSPKKLKLRADFDVGKLHGVLKFDSPNGTVRVRLDITGLPEQGGPFTYHIHNNPVPASKDCEATGTHFNPYGAPPDCDSQPDDSYCQVGDLSGKHGWINTTCFATTYYDPYLSLNPDNLAYIVGRSVNLHYANLDKIACSNIQVYKGKVKTKEGFFYDAGEDDEEDENVYELIQVKRDVDQEQAPTAQELSFAKVIGNSNTSIVIEGHKNHSNPSSTGNYSYTTVNWESENGVGMNPQRGSFGALLFAFLASFVI